MSKDDGGPAFPQPEGPAGDMPWRHGFGGLSARDLFAGLALVGMLANRLREGTLDDFASDAYHYADAMLKARKEDKTDER